MKLNLGCGTKLLSDYVNVDKYGKADIVHNLEEIPYPWKNNEIEEIILHHVLEHLGETPTNFMKIMKEFYRICKPNSLIKITVPHPRSDNFINDPTHIRIITYDTLVMFSKKFNLECQKQGYSNSQFGLEYDVDFEITKYEQTFYSEWDVNNCKFDRSFAIKHYNNVIMDLYFELKVIKEEK